VGGSSWALVAVDAVCGWRVVVVASVIVASWGRRLVAWVPSCRCCCAGMLPRCCLWVSFVVEER
jgi:hypothetical protein